MVLDADKECPEGWTEFLDQHWYGLREGCNCNNDKDDPDSWEISKIYGRECRGVQEQTLQKCVRIEPVEAQKIRIFRNKLICRKPMESTINYLRKQWVNETTKECSDKTMRLCGAIESEYY